MLHLIPAPLHRRLYRVADHLRRQWWRVRRPRRHSVLVIAFDARGHVLLVRHSYGPPVWALPGGGVDRGEDPERAAVREIREELGCGLTELIVVEESEVRDSGSLDLRHVYAARIDGVPAPDMREIVAVRFVDPEGGLEQCGRYMRQWIERAVAQRKSGGGYSEER